MSWDIFIQDLPKGLKSIEEIPKDFKPKPLGKLKWVRDTVRKAVPKVEFGDDGCGTADLPGGSIEIYVGDDDPVDSIMLAIRADDRILPVVESLVKAFGGLALDPGTKSGLFELKDSAESLAEWTAFRDSQAEAVRSAGKKAKKKAATKKKAGKSRKGGSAKPGKKGTKKKVGKKKRKKM